jgi:hypothetical protein
MHDRFPHFFIPPCLITEINYIANTLFIFNYRYLIVIRFTNTVAHSFHFRSLEYVGPILKALSTAYDKYAVPLIKKKE